MQRITTQLATTACTHTHQPTPKLDAQAVVAQPRKKIVSGLFVKVKFIDNISLQLRFRRIIPEF